MRSGTIASLLIVIIVTAGIGFLLLFLTTAVFYVECAQKASSCSDSFYSVFDILVVVSSAVGVAVAGGKVVVGRVERGTSLRGISILAINGLVLTLAYGLIPTMAYGLEYTINYGFPFTVFVQSSTNSFYPFFVILNYIFWFGLGNLAWAGLILHRLPKSTS